ncbi:hypothetical protein BGZ76_010810, partial [Entomortierella beljakovae]
VHTMIQQRNEALQRSYQNSPLHLLTTPGKLVPMMTGYIEAIEARLHRMEGLLGGLVKDKDPRAEIVRAELDAMAREAEMTGLKLRRSKAYEEINHAMSNASIPNNGSGIAPSAMSSRIQPQQQQQQQSQHIPPRPIPQTTHIMPNVPVKQSPSGYRTNSSTPLHTDNSPSQVSSPNRSQPPIPPTSISPVPRSNQYHPYEHPRSISQSNGPQQSQHTNQRHQHQTSITSNSTYTKVGQQHPPQLSQHSPVFNDTSYSSPNQSTSYTENHHHHAANYRRSSHSIQPHQQPQTSHDSNYDYDRSSNNYGNNTGSKSTYSVDSNKSYGNGDGKHYSAYQIHRSSQTAPQLSNPLTGYMCTTDTYGSDTLILPSQEVMSQLMEVYFRHTHPVLPMLHTQAIQDQIHRNESPPTHLLFAMLGVASRFSDNNVFRTPIPEIGLPPCAIFYERARHFIRGVYDVSSITTVQTMILMAVQQMGFCESQRAWLYIGMAIRMSQELGLNKMPSDQELARNRVQCVLRKRTWWSVYVIERLICAGLGRPLTITDHDCERIFSQSEDEDADLHELQPHVISNFSQLIKLSKIQGDILEYINTKYVPSAKTGNTRNSGFSSEQDQKTPTINATLSSLDRSLAEWRQNLPEPLQNPTVQSPHFHLFLHLTFNTLVILLHRPEVGASQNSTSMCNQAAAAISDIIEILMDTGALTSIFVSCIYAIFSAGVIHFLNIPSVHRPAISTASSPIPTELHRPLTDHAKTAKSSLKRCIDALKYLSTHWLSAARRAKVLEDLLDLKHVSIKDLEEDTFKSTPVGPSWVLTSQYKDFLVGKSQDKLRQQCRSKVMAIHSLLANDDEFTKMQHQRRFSFSEPTDDDSTGSLEESPERDLGIQDNDITGSVAQQGHIGLEANSTISPTSNETNQSPLDLDLVTTISTTNQVSNDSLVSNTKIEGDSNILVGLDNGKSDLLMPMTMTTLHNASQPFGMNSSKSDSQTSYLNNGSSNSAMSTPNSQASMLDPFSMPSSISFPDWNQGRVSNSVDTDSSTKDFVVQQYPVISVDLPSASSPVNSSNNLVSTPTPPPTIKTVEEQDLDWNDMPPTLGLDEWTAYIGAMMMRWLYASGQSPAGSTPS